MVRGEGHPCGCGVGLAGQEGAIRELVDKLSAADTVLSGLDRARIAVLAERWGCGTAALMALVDTHRTQT